MPERVRVEYSRKLSAKAGDEYNTEQLGAGWEFEVPDGADFQSEYNAAFAVVKLTVENLFKTLNTRKAPAPTRAATLPGERFASEPQYLQGGDYSDDYEPEEKSNEIIEGEEYEFANARVWKVEAKNTRAGKKYAVVRIGNRDQIPGNGYASVKSFNPLMVSKLLALEEGDHVDVRGTFEGWDGNNGRMYDFVPIELEKVRDVRRS